MNIKKWGATMPEGTMSMPCYKSISHEDGSHVGTAMHPLFLCLLSLCSSEADGMNHKSA